MSQPALFDVVAVECFFRCGTVVRDPDPLAAHQAMETHYAERHRAELNDLVGKATP